MDLLPTEDVVHRPIRITTILAIVVMLVLSSSCGSKHKDLGKAITDRDTIPTLATYKLTTLISDSGIIRYRIQTDEWKIYDHTNPPRWTFEKKAHLERFDLDNKVDVTIDADTAYYYTKTKLWELRGHVKVRNIKGEQFTTELLYWDERKGSIYSERFITIEQADKTITGHGFESNQEMTVYVIHHPEGVVYVDEEKAYGPTEPDTAARPMPDAEPPIRNVQRPQKEPAPAIEAVEQAAPSRTDASGGNVRKDRPKRGVRSSDDNMRIKRRDLERNLPAGEKDVQAIERNKK